jgi:serine/threonine protein kinase
MNLHQINTKKGCITLLNKTPCNINLSFLDELSDGNLNHLLTQLQTLEKDGRISDVDITELACIINPQIPLYFYHNNERLSLRKSQCFLPNQGFFSPTEVLGTGGYGTVRKFVSNSSGSAIAVKSARIRNPHFENEQKVFNYVHENQKALFFDSESDKRLILPFIAGKNLYQRLPLIKTQLVDVSLNSAIELRYLHQKGIVHNDFRMQNIMVGEDNQVKLIDFGESLTDMPELKTVDICMYCKLFLKLYIKQYNQEKDTGLLDVLRWLKKGRDRPGSLDINDIIKKLKEFKTNKNLAVVEAKDKKAINFQN